MITAILQFFGRILLWIYNFCGNYALSLAIFTLLTKLVLFPLSYKGKQNMMQMHSMNAEMQRLQKQYGKDQQRYQQELQKLYEEEQVNPMGGCLWSLLPLPIMMGLYYVIRKPMLYMLCLTEDQISTVKEALVAAQSGILDGVSQAYEEIRIMSVISQDSSLYQVAANALGDAADKLRALGMDRALRAAASRGTPLLGICLGMQMLFERSHEYGVHEGLGLLKGEIRPIAEKIPAGFKIPQMGWNALKIVKGSPLLKYTKAGEYVYFVHSYSAVDCDDSLLAVTEYGADLTACVGKGNVFGCQFHPEKSSDVGLRILKAFCEMGVNE